jgi:hypothetical protein
MTNHINVIATRRSFYTTLVASQSSSRSLSALFTIEAQHHAKKSFYWIIAMVQMFCAITEW